MNEILYSDNFIVIIVIDDITVDDLLIFLLIRIKFGISITAAAVTFISFFALDL
jgi:hypothetical protein